MADPSRSLVPGKYRVRGDEVNNNAAEAAAGI